jgi:hypothetical protein
MHGATIKIYNYYFTVLYCLTEYTEKYEVT